MSSTHKATLSLYRSFIQVARAWPQDKLRKELQFKHALRAATHRVFLRNPPSPSQLPDRVAESATAGDKVRITGVYTPRTESQNAAGRDWAALQHLDDEKILDGGKNLRVLSQEEFQYAKKSLLSLQHLLSNKPSQKFPTPQELLAPPTSQSYYKQLQSQVALAEQGKELPDFTPVQKLKIFLGFKPHEV